MRLRTLFAVVTSLAITGAAVAVDPGAASPSELASHPPIRHVLIIELENKGFDETFGPDSPAPFLSQELRSKGLLLEQYYGIGHASLDNYIAQISGQAPNVETQGDCQIFTDFVPNAPTAFVTPGQAVGHGCVYPPDVLTLPDQLEATGFTWKGYMEDMGTPCRHPALNTPDETQSAKVGDQYAARHNPFVYFHSIIDDQARCDASVVPLERLPIDLARKESTPNFTFITPNLCNDGHDAGCVDGAPGGLVSADAFLRRWVPQILASPAFKRDGLLIVTFDEADIAGSPDASACCGEGPGPNSPMPGIFGMGGGRTGAVLISRFIRPGTTSAVPYNHYSALCSIEELFGLTKLGYAATTRPCFGPDVYNRNV